MADEAEKRELQQQLTQARCVIGQLASQVDHHKDVQKQLAGMPPVRDE